MQCWTTTDDDISFCHQCSRYTFYGFHGGGSSNDGHLLGLCTAYRTQFLQYFQGMYSLHIQGDWTGFSDCWTDTEEEIHRLDRRLQGFWPVTATGGEARMASCPKTMEAWKGDCSWKSNYYWLKTLLSLLLTFSNSDWSNILKPFFITDTFSSIQLLQHSNEPIPYPEDGGSTFLRSTRTIKLQTADPNQGHCVSNVLPGQITKAQN